jgi:Tol biopolymer transport system component
MRKLLLSLVLFITSACFALTLSALGIGQNSSNTVIAYTESCEIDVGTYFAKVYIADWRYSIRRPLPEQSVPFVPPSWSPDGQQLAYTVNLNGEYEVYRRDLTTGLALNFSGSLSSSNTSNISPTWSPNGHSIAFSSNVYVAVADTGTGNIQSYPVQISNNGFSDAWSPDGDLFAFGGSYPNTRGDIYILNIVTGEIEKLPTELLDMANKPSWSPDGRYLTFTGSEFEFGRSAIYRAELATDTISQLTKGDIPNYVASSWSPDGEMIATMTENSEVHLFNLEGELTQKLNFQQIDGLGGGEGQVRWSPDGNYLALILPVYSLYRNYVYSLSSGEIYSISPKHTCYYSPVAWRPEPVT